MSVDTIPSDVPPAAIRREPNESIFALALRLLEEAPNPPVDPWATTTGDLVTPATLDRVLAIDERGVDTERLFLRFWNCRAELATDAAVRWACDVLEAGFPTSATRVLALVAEANRTDVPDAIDAEARREAAYDEALRLYDVYLAEPTSERHQAWSDFTFTCGVPRTMVLTYVLSMLGSRVRERALRDRIAAERAGAPLVVGHPGYVSERLARDAERAIEAGNRAEARASALTKLVVELECDARALVEYRNADAAVVEVGRTMLARIDGVTARIGGGR